MNRLYTNKVGISYETKDKAVTGPLQGLLSYVLRQRQD